jgi:alkylation response protein AidB-like acyl-CoA dehydrogenase
MPVETSVVDEAIDGLLREHPPATTGAVTFLRAQFDAGLAYVWFPVGYGGLAQPMDAQPEVDERLRAAGAPASGRVTNAVAAGQGAASILAYGSEEQKQRYLRPFFSGELMGIQLYSEPGSGSDLASLSTRAERHGDEWIVNGLKVGSAAGGQADVAMLLARSDSEASRHAGLTQFILDMRAPGIEVRPVRQMTGSAAYSEVLLTDVAIPDSDRLGAVNHGWSVSQHTLVLERTGGPRRRNRGEGAIALAVAAWQARPDKSSPAARALRSELLRHWVDAEVVRLLQLRSGVLRAQGSSGAEASLGKLAVSTTGRRLAEWAPALLGPAGGLLEEGYPTADGNRAGRRGRGSVVSACIASPSLAIAGGTDQIQRNIIGERVLGLPPEPKVDRSRADGTGTR